MFKLLLSKITRNPFHYDVWELVNRKYFLSSHDLHHPMQIISDIDKTYLETDFHNLRDMAKIAMETAHHKRTVPGARSYLRTLKWNEDSKFIHHKISPPLHFISSSPVQLRDVLEKKLALDALLCCSNSFKNQMYNLKKGRLSLLRHQVAYKVASLLSLISKFKDTQHIVMLGDDYESDPFIYMLVKCFIQGSLSVQEAITCLEYLHVPNTISEEIFQKISILPCQAKVYIFIRKIGSDLQNTVSHPLGQSITWFQGYDDLAWMSYHIKLLTWQGLSEFLESFYGEASVLPKRIIQGWQIYQKWSQNKIPPPTIIARWIENINQNQISHIYSPESDTLYQDLSSTPCTLRSTELVELFQSWSLTHSRTIPDKEQDFATLSKSSQSSTS